MKDLLGEVTARSRNQIADYSDAPVKFRVRGRRAQADVHRVICVDESGAHVAVQKVPVLQRDILCPCWVRRMKTAR